MIITATRDEGTITLALDGRLDTSSSPQFHEALTAAFEEAGQVTIDLANLAYVSSAGLRVFLMGQKAAQAKNWSMTVSHVPESVMEVFDMTGFSDLLTIV